MAPSAEFSFIWSLHCPPKISFFLWLIAHGRLPTIDMLQNRRIDVHATCLFCTAPETASHLFLHCDFAKSVWDVLTMKLKWLYAMPENVALALQAWQLNLSDKAKSEIWRLVPVAIIWCLWKERNNRVFNGNPSSAAVVAHKVVYMLFTWSLDFKYFEEVDSKEVMRNWCKIYFDIH
ncbi:uncharacterized protein LOC113334556 [Papaver somniferum]|uniref:uncharacterized protein LOC113334556 n=1 Tax=Papaver somniferum TaxID=3469 RepID=UPI000E6F7678|nr:uncharacterized protein LOC113334556 [Papaver somniferum]